MLASPLRAQTSWSELKGEHFIIEYAQENRDFARQVLDAAENYYRTVAEDLGYTRYSKFWSWENRVKIVIYPDHKSYVAGTGAKEWSQGFADLQKRMIITYRWNKNFLDALLPHEITHLIFRDFIGFKDDVPLWLDEGVAQWEEKPLRAKRFKALKEIVRRKSLIPLAAMMKLDVRNISEDSIVRIEVTREGKQIVMQLKGADAVGIFYLQAFSLVGFLIQEYGTDKFTEFCRQLRDGNDLSSALSYTYPTDIRSLSDLDKRWNDYLRNMLKV